MEVVTRGLLPVNRFYLVLCLRGGGGGGDEVEGEGHEVGQDP